MYINYGVSPTCVQVAGVIYPGFINRPAKNGEFQGLSIDFLRLLSAFYKQCFEFLLHRTSAIRYSNGTFGGIHGKILTKEYEFSLVPANSGLVMADTERTDVSTFSLIGGGTIILPAPTVNKNVMGFMTVFPWIIWITIALTALAVLGVVMFVGFVKMTKRDVNISKEKARGTWITAPLISQAYTKTPSHISNRIIVGTWMLMTLCLALSYKSMVMSGLIIPRVSKVFDTIDEIENYNGKVKIYMVKGTYLAANIMKYPKGSPLRRLGAKVSGITPYGDLRTRLLKGDKTFSAYVPILPLMGQLEEIYMSTKSCDWTFTEQKFNWDPRRFIFAQGSIWRWRFDNVMTRLLESGIFKHIFESYSVNARRCVTQKVNYSQIVRPLGLDDFFGIFSLWFIGMMIASGAFLVELVIPKVMSK